MALLLPCPFCGEHPNVRTDGSFIEIHCCVSMDRQKSDYLSPDERCEWDRDLQRYRGVLERKVFMAVAAEWNKRVS